MAKKKIVLVPKRRKREGRTDYRKRLFLLKGRKSRVVIRKSLNSVLVQLVQYQAIGDKVLATISSTILSEHGWKYKKNNLPACYLTGLLMAKKAKELGVKEAIADIGLQPSVKGNKLYAVVKGLLDGGLQVPSSKEVLPSMDRISGKHIQQYYSQQKEGVQFQAYRKMQVTPELIVKDFEQVKKKIMG